MNLESNTLSLRERLEIEISKIKDGSMNQLSERLKSDIYYANKKDYSWDLFYDLLELEPEQIDGYYLPASVATSLLSPLIATTFEKSKNARVNELVGEDFTSEVCSAIVKALPNYDRAKANFPKYIQLYIKQCGHVHNKDATVYMQQNTGIRILSQDSFVTQNLDNSEDGGPSKDPFFCIKSDFNLEDEVDYLLREQSSSIFEQAVVNKGFRSGEKESHKRTEWLNNLRKESEKIKNRLEVIESRFKNIDPSRELSDKELAILEKVNKEKETIEKRKDKIDKLLSKSKSKKIMERDWRSTMEDSVIWKKFLGGVSNYGNTMLDEIVHYHDDDEMIKDGDSIQNGVLVRSDDDCIEM